jgi:hypothetical protein
MATIRRARIQQMTFPQNYRPDPKLRGKLRRIKQVLIERGLWRAASDGINFLLDWCVTGMMLIS